MEGVKQDQVIEPKHCPACKQAVTTSGRKKAAAPPKLPSNSERRRWLLKGSVSINMQRPGPRDVITLPVWELTFFPDNAKRRCSMLAEYWRGDSWIMLEDKDDLVDIR